MPSHFIPTQPDSEKLISQRAKQEAHKRDEVCTRRASTVAPIKTTLIKNHCWYKPTLKINCIYCAED